MLKNHCIVFSPYLVFTHYFTLPWESAWESALLHTLLLVKHSEEENTSVATVPIQTKHVSACPPKATKLWAPE